MNLREQIIAEMKKQEEKQKETFGEMFHRDAFSWYCTWWFKFSIAFETKEIRRELEIMERDGVVKSDREQSNNTKWMLITE